MALTHEEMLSSFQDEPLAFEPGSRLRYSNSGYYLLGMVIEHVSGGSYEEFMYSRVFAPVGLENTGYSLHDTIIKRRVANYAYGGGGYGNAYYWDMSQAFGDGGLYSTLGDLHAWNRAVMHGEVLPTEVMTRAFTRVTLDDGAAPPYGLGWRLSDVRGLARIWHTGGGPGFNAIIVYHPALDATVVVLTNLNVDADRLAREVSEVYYHDEMDAQERQ